MKLVYLLTIASCSPVPGKRVLDPNAAKNVVCTDKATKLNGHQINVAILSICGGIAGKIQKCQGNPASSTGISGDAKFEIKPVNAGATINVSKGRWEAGVFAARAICGDSPFTATFPLGTTNGDLQVALVKNTPAKQPAKSLTNPPAKQPAKSLTNPPAKKAHQRVLDPNAAKNVVCTDKATKLNDHQINVAILSICGGIAGKIQKCQGNPASSTGISGDAKFEIKPVNAGATINVSKGRWEAGVFAARAICGDSPFTATFPLGTTNGDLQVALTKNQ
ncbi:hypothetical protein HDV04_005002 [Boothiomyces sp. JEL0838]|nr:hypothetical protein HDV04_005002 [Boothiomyces sp. JEL0838]